MKNLLHRVWRSLPYDARRRVLLTMSSALAPRRPRHACRTEPIFIAGFFSAASGLGELARLLYAAYVRQAAPVYGIDLSSSFRQGNDVSFDFSDGRAHRGEGTLILVVNAPLVPLALMILGRGFLADKWRIGYWAWELPDLPPEWSIGARSVHEIWAISTFCAEAMQKRLRLPVRVVLPPLAGPPSASGRARCGPEDSGPNLTVLTAFNMASSFERKNPLDAISAFKTAFGQDSGVRLRVKIAHGRTYPEGLRMIAHACRGYDNIEVLTEGHPSGRLNELLAEADVLLSLHRAEGFGLLFGQAMHLGKAIVATGWSGNLDVLTDDNAFLVPVTLVPARDPQRTYHWPGTYWAEPSVTAAAEILRRLRSDPALRARKGGRAQTDAAALLSAQSAPRFAPAPSSRPASRSPSSQAGTDDAAAGNAIASSLLPSGSMMKAPK